MKYSSLVVSIFLNSIHNWSVTAHDQLLGWEWTFDISVLLQATSGGGVGGRNEKAGAGGWERVGWYKRQEENRNSTVCRKTSQRKDEDCKLPAPNFSTFVPNLSTLLLNFSTFVPNFFTFFLFFFLCF